jgi:hypothetical protein
VQTFDTNPGRPVFPWLSTQADGWEQYRYRSLEYELIPRRGTGSAGSIIAAFDYNVYDAPPDTETAMSSYTGAVEDTLWQGLRMHVDIKAYHAGSERKYIRSGLPPGDRKSYDGGQLFVATVGDSSPGTVSHKLWVNYEVELFVPETEAKIRPFNFLDVNNSVDRPLPSSAWTTLLMDQPIYNGIEAVATATGWTLPRGFYEVTLNASFEATNGTATNHTVTSAIRVMLDGIWTGIDSRAGGSVPDSTVGQNAEFENTCIGCFRIDNDDGLLETQFWANDPFAAGIAFLYGLTSMRMVIKKLG